MTRYKLNAQRTQQSGIALLEFVILVPILLIWAFGLLEVGLAFSAQQRIAALTREVAQAIYSTCEGSSSDQTALQLCIEAPETQTAIDSLLTALFPQNLPYSPRAKVWINVFVPSGGGGNAALLATINFGTLSNKPAKFSNISAEVKQLANDLGHVYVIEVFYARPMFNPLSKLIRVMLPADVHKVEFR